MIYRESNVAENPNNHNSNGRLGFKEIQGWQPKKMVAKLSHWVSGLYSSVVKNE